MAQISAINKSVYDHISMGEVQKRWVETTDGKQMLTWVILPPDFDPSKNIPHAALLPGRPPERRFKRLELPLELLS